MNRSPEEFEEPIFDETQPQVILPGEYNGCIIGNTVGVFDIPRLVYSLNRLADVELKKMLAENQFADPEDARKLVWEMVMDISGRFGPRTPVFVDDVAFRQEDKPKLWTPGGN